MSIYFNVWIEYFNIWHGLKGLPVPLSYSVLTAFKTGHKWLIKMADATSSAMINCSNLQLEQ